MSKKVTHENKQKEQRQAASDMQQRFANTFTSPEGWEVFKYMLKEMGVFDPVTCPEEQILHNYGKILLYRVMGTDGEDAIEAQMLGVRKYIEAKKM